MKIEYIARKATLNDSVRELTEKKLQKLKKYFNEILEIKVELDAGTPRRAADGAAIGPREDAGLASFHGSRWRLPREGRSTRGRRYAGR